MENYILIYFIGYILALPIMFYFLRDGEEDSPFRVKDLIDMLICSLLSWLVVAGALIIITGKILLYIFVAIYCICQDINNSKLFNLVIFNPTKDNKN